MRWIERFAAMMLLSTAVTGVWAQDAASSSAQEPDEAEAPVKWRLFSFGYNGWDETGNGNKLRQYATPARGFQIGELRLVAPANGKSPYARLLLRGSPDADRLADGIVGFDGGRGFAKASVSRHEFYDSTPMRIAGSAEDNAEATVQYAISPDIGAFYRFKQKTRNLSFEGPKEQTYFRTKSVAGGIQGKALGGNVGVTVADDRYFDKTGEEPNSIQHRIAARYSAAPTDAISVEGVFSQTNIEQVGRTDGEVKSWAFSADWDFAPATALLLHMRRDEIDLPIIHNAHVQERFITSARLVHRMRGVSLQAGYQHREYERVRADQQYVDVPTWDTYDAKISGRFSGGIRYSLSGSWEHLSDRATMLTNDSRALYWDDRVRAQFKLFGGDDRFSGYATYGFRFDQNTPRDIEIRSHGLTLGGSYVFDEKMSAYLELAGMQFDVSGGEQETGFSLSSYFPGSTSVSLGVNYVPGPDESASLGLSWFGTDNDNPLGERDNNVRSTQLSASYRRQMSPDCYLELTYSPWRYTDRVVETMSYRSTVLGISFTGKF